MHIVYVNPEYPSRSGQDHGGIATYIYCMANALAQAGNIVEVLAKSGTVPDSLYPGVRFRTFKHVPARRPFPWLDRLSKNNAAWEQGYSRSARELILKIHAEKPVDCVEIPEYNGLAVEFTQPLPFPVIIHFHTPTYLVDSCNNRKVTMRHRRWYALEKKGLSRAAGFRSPSISLKREVCPHYGIDENRVSVIPHPMDTSVFDAIQRNDDRKDVIDILFSGRLERRKGGEILLRDAGRLLSLDPRIQITFAGELDMGESGNYRSAIERSLTERQRHRIWLLGAAKRSDLPVLYRRSDVFVMPSLFENAPYALLEAMAAQLPVVAARTSGLAELMHDGETGLLFDLESQDGLVDAVKSLTASPERGRAMARNAYALVKDLCAPNKIARQSMDFYSAIIESSKTASPAHARR